MDDGLQERLAVKLNGAAVYFDFADLAGRQPVLEQKRILCADHGRLHRPRDDFRRIYIDIRYFHRRELFARIPVKSAGRRIGIDNPGLLGIHEHHHRAALFEQRTIPLLAFFQHLFGPCALGDIAGGSDNELGAGRIGVQRLFGDDRFDVPARGRQQFLVDALLPALEHLLVLGPENVRLLLREIIGVRFAQKLLPRITDEPALGFVHQHPAVPAILHENGIRDGVDDLVQEFPGLPKRLLGLHPLRPVDQLDNMPAAVKRKMRLDRPLNSILSRNDVLLGRDAVAILRPLQLLQHFLPAHLLQAQHPDPIGHMADVLPPIPRQFLHRLVAGNHLAGQQNGDGRDRALLDDRLELFLRALPRRHVGDHDQVVNRLPLFILDQVGHDLAHGPLARPERHGDFVRVNGFPLHPPRKIIHQHFFCFRGKMRKVQQAFSHNLVRPEPQPLRQALVRGNHDAPGIDNHNQLGRVFEEDVELLLRLPRLV